MKPLEYFFTCIFAGTLIPWFLFWIGYIIIFHIGALLNPLKTKESVRNAIFFCVFYLIATPVFATLVAIIEPIFGYSGLGEAHSSGLFPSAKTSLFMLAHSFLMWGIIMFLVGAISGSGTNKKQPDNISKTNDMTEPAFSKPRIVDEFLEGNTKKSPTGEDSSKDYDSLEF